MHYFLTYSGNERNDGCPRWAEVSYPLVDNDVDLERQYYVGNNTILKNMEGSEILFDEKFIDFDYFDQYKDIIIVSEKFVHLLQDLKCDFSCASVTIKTMDNKRRYINSVRKKYFVLMINKRINCIDYENSEYCVRRDADGKIIYNEVSGEPEIKYLYQMAVDESRTFGEPIFYSKDFKSNGKPICSDKFCMKFSKLDFKGIYLKPTIFDVMDYPDFKRDKWVIDKITLNP